jgi:hypothetical protein
MYYLKNRYFHRWARKQGITDQALWEVVSEFEKGLYEADLGSHLYKKRIALPGRGKSSGARTILFYQIDRKLIFCLGFEKSHQANLTEIDRKFLRKLSDFYQRLMEEEIINDIKHGDLIEILKTEG